MIETRRIITGIIQSSRGTPGSPSTGANYLEASGIGHPEIEPILVPNEEFSPLDTQAAPQAVDPVWNIGQDEFACRLGSAAGAAMPIGFLLRAAGLDEQLTASTKADYLLKSQAPSARKVATLDKYVDGEKFSFKDVVAAAAAFAAKVGEPLKFSFDGRGLANGACPDTVAFPASATASTTQARLIMQSATAITEDGTEIAVEEFSLDLAPQIGEFYDSKNARGFEVLNLIPVLTIKKLASVASADYAKIAAATALAFVATFGSGRTLVFDMPVAVPNANSRSDTNKRLFDQLTYSLHDNAGDDALKITST